MDTASVVMGFYIFLISLIPLAFIIPLFVFAIKVLRKLDRFLDLKIVECEIKDKFL